MARLLIWLGVAALSAAAFFSGSAWLRGALPVAITALIAGVFAYTLRSGRRPLIARAIAAIDGPHWLDDPAVARYARRLTQVWAAYLVLLALVVAVLALRVPGEGVAWAGVARVGTLGVPLAIAALFIGEFMLRRWLLPQAPRRGFIEFTLALVRHWPALLVDHAVAPITAIDERLCIDATHPALPGHFPDNPVVPGVVMLERVAAAVERGFGARMAGLPQVKFLRPLRPHDVADLHIERDGASARFTLRHAGESIATGALELLP